MPKLIVKQEVTKAPWQRMIYVVVAVILVLSALLVYFLFIAKIPTHAAMRDLPKDSQITYQKQYDDLQHLIQGYKISTHSGKETLAKNKQLITQINMILDQLLTMSEWVENEEINPNTREALLANLQYDMDVWNGNLHFQQLRASRLETEPPKKKGFQFAKPSADMVLPEGFCTLTGANSCKPTANDTKAPYSDLEPTDTDDSIPLFADKLD